jgi:hypothetical protein
LGAVSVAIVAAVVVLPATGTSAPSSTPAAITLVQAQSQLSALAATADAPGQAALDDAVGQLTAAFPDNSGSTGSLSSLWADAQDANVPVPPPYGETVFRSTRAAAKDLVGILSDPTVPRAALDGAGDAILEADQAITDNALSQAGLPFSPNGSAFGPGSPGQITADESRWEGAYRVLGTQIDHVVTTLPPSTIDQAAENLLESPIESPTFLPQPVTGTALTADGKPEFFYFGTEGCPYCAIDRWSMVVALSQFGHFSPLALNVSSTVDGYPGTDTFTFYGSTYQSSYLSFVPVEGFTNQRPPGSNGPPCGAAPWSKLQELSFAQQQLMAAYDPGCGYPFLDVGNRWTTIGAYADVQVVQGMSWTQIASALADPGSAVAQSVEGGAVLLTAQICEVTGEQPASVCGSSVVQQWQAGLP